ncbi:unnamed protein product [Soboliphyme baturini]|uniref:Retrovirus-related Pol polyprotein from transposon TNT 1-94 n=1 Tax=Soboliphyme baturini TaxID=241478 RepID=A0A183JB98_9BILA|nr:unnamed protein product [Soboliphyme baturini]
MRCFEETRIRAVTMINKVYLQHLIPLSTLASFPDFWITVLDIMAKYYHTDNVDLVESIPESVKNMLLVMKTAGLFTNIDGLLQLTTNKLSSFLPDLSETLNFEVTNDSLLSSTRDASSPIPANIHPQASNSVPGNVDLKTDQQPVPVPVVNDELSCVVCIERDD